MVVKWPYAGNTLHVILTGDKRSEISHREVMSDMVYISEIYSRYNAKDTVTGRDIREGRIFVFPTLKELKINPLDFWGNVGGARLINFVLGFYGNMVFMAAIEAFVSSR